MADASALEEKLEVLADLKIQMRGKKKEFDERKKIRNSILLLLLSRFAVRNFFPSVSYLFYKFLRAGTVLKKGCASSRPKAENL